MLMFPTEEAPQPAATSSARWKGLTYVESSLLNSLIPKATEAAPEHPRPGIVFVKVPQNWVDLSTGNLGVDYRRCLGDAGLKFFPTAKRIVLVVFYAKLTSHGAGGDGFIPPRSAQRENPQSRYARDRSWRLFTEVKEPPDWIDFSRLYGRQPLVTYGATSAVLDAEDRVLKSFTPMTLANMRANGVRVVIAQCESCGRSADVNVDALPETVEVPKASQRLRCGRCGGRTINTRPAWHTAARRRRPPTVGGVSRPKAGAHRGRDRDQASRRGARAQTH